MSKNSQNFFARVSSLAIIAAVAFGCTVGPSLSEERTEARLINWRFEPSATGAEQPSFATQFPAPDFVAGITGRAWRSDGFSSWVSQSLNLAPDKGFTAQTWIALESYPSGYERPVEDIIPASIMQQAGKDNGFDVYIDAFGRWGLRVETVAGPLQVQAKEGFPLNQWSHVAASYDPTSGEATLYLDGKVVGTKTGKPSHFKPASAPFEIAHSWRDAPMDVFNINGLNGAFDDVQVSGIVLSPLQIAAASLTPPPPARPSLVVPASRFAADIQRPTYHAMPPANWTNEPHGLMRRGDSWHMFYQRTPNGPFKTLMTWGHVKSKDLIHWTDLPIALKPELQTDDFGFDMKGIWSGDVVTGPHGWAFAFYTSVNHSAKFYNPGVSLAVSDDPDLLHWQKLGPLIDTTGVVDFRDPYVWFEDGEARMIVGAALGKGGGLAYYRCKDISVRSCWKKQARIAPFEAMDVGSEIWEMPVFKPMGTGKYILEVNPIGGAVSKYGTPSTRGVYWIGTWNGSKFTPDDLRPKMLDLVPGHLSPTVDTDANGQIIAIGIVDERRSAQDQKDAGWAHTFSLPRVWRLMPDGKTLGQSPLPALSALRRSEGMIAKSLTGTGDQTVGELGRAIELEVSFETVSQDGTFGLILAQSADGSERTRFYYDAATDEMVLDKQASTLSKGGEGPDVLRGAYDVAAFGAPRKFHIFVDHSVIDVFINDAAAASFRIYPTKSDSSQFGIMSSGTVTATVKAWTIAPAPIEVR